jgi:lysine-arginine-ornithine-binding protein
MKRLSVIIVVALAALGAFFLLRSGGGDAANDTATHAGDIRREIRIGTEGAYPPFNYIDEKGQLNGFDIDMVKAMCEEAKFRCTFVAQDWDGLIPGLLTHKYDAIAASMSITEERRKTVDFTNRYYRTPIRFVTRRDSLLVVSAEGMEGKTIGVQRATTSASYLRDTFGNAVSVRYYDTQENAYLDLTAGRIDAVLADAIQLWKWLQGADGQNYDFRGETIYVDDGIGIAIRKGDEELANAFNQALQGIRANGTYDAISNRYFPFSIY